MKNNSFSVRLSDQELSIIRKTAQSEGISVGRLFVKVVTAYNTIMKDYCSQCGRRLPSNK